VFVTGGRCSNLTSQRARSVCVTLSVFFICVSFSSTRSSAFPFPFVKIQNSNPKPVFDHVQTRNPGLEKDARVWNPYRQHRKVEGHIKIFQPALCSGILCPPLSNFCRRHWLGSLHVNFLISRELHFHRPILCTEFITEQASPILRSTFNSSIRTLVYCHIKVDELLQ